MPDAPLEQPPDLDHQAMDDKNFETSDLAQSLALVGLPKFLTRRRAINEVETYLVEDPHKRVLGEVRWSTNGGWEVAGTRGDVLAMVWRQHTEDHSQERLSTLVHQGLRRYEKAVAAEENASIYCLANLDRTVRMFVTYKGNEAILDAPSNRPVLKMAPAKRAGDVEFVDAFDEPVAHFHTDATFHEVHEVAFEEAAEPFPVVLFAVTLGLEMGFRHGGWRSPYHHTEL